jgi:putative ABC transport system permease protein
MNWLALALAQFRSQPLRTLAAVAAIAFGVALVTAIHLVNAVALDEFGAASRRLTGDASLVVQGPARGFDESLFVTLARDPRVEVASPVVELDVALAGRRGSLRLLGLDTFRAATLQPALVGSIGGDFLGLFAPDAVYLSPAAARELGLARGERFAVEVGSTRRELVVRGLLAEGAYPRAVGVLDIASAQWLLDRVGRLNRIDLRVAPGVDVTQARAALQPLLPPGVTVVTPAIAAGQAASFSRAYRVNLDMLALVSLLTGSLLLFSTQSLSVLKRRSALALLRALGMTRGELLRALVGEGLLLGAVGAALGVLAGLLLAAVLLVAFGGSFGVGEGTTLAGRLLLRPLSLLALFVIGTVIAALGALVPAIEAARRAPARGLKSGDAEEATAALRPSRTGLALVAVALPLALLPEVGGLPVFGYLSIAALLFGALMLVPVAARAALARLPTPDGLLPGLALSQLRGSAGQVTIGLAALVASFSLMVAMAIMVFSFRESFDRWLATSLPAELQLRVVPGSDTRVLDERAQAAIRSAAGVASVRFQRSDEVLLAGEATPTALLARDALTVDADLPLVSAAFPVVNGETPAWISEAVQDRLGAGPGSTLVVPLDGRPLRTRVAGVYRDYGHAGGAIAIDRAVYVEATGDAGVTDAAIHTAARADATSVAATLRAALGRGDGAIEIRASDEIRRIAMRAFDRAFQVTYALEVAAVLIGLVGIACAGAATALARRGEFAMLRHVGLRRRDIIGLLGWESAGLASFGALYGLLLGALISLVLVYVVNRQSFDWSIDLAMPWLQVAVFSAALVAASTVTGVLSARSATRASVLAAVREDW